MVLTLNEIKQRIEAALTAAGIPFCTPEERERRYDDSVALAVVKPEDQWKRDAVCSVVIFADRVARWTRDTPYNLTDGLLTIDSVGEIPEVMRPRRIEVGPKATEAKPQQIERQRAAGFLLPLEQVRSATAPVRPH